MAAVAGRKKSVISTSGLHIDTPVANNTLLNKAASQSTSLYQQCSSLRARLMRIRGFSPYFALASSPDSRQSTDPVTQLWDLFTMGIPLCYIFNQLPEDQGYGRIGLSTALDQDLPDRTKKHAIAMFAVQMRGESVIQNIPGCEAFTVTDLWDRNSTDGLVKVINIVTKIVDLLPADSFEASPPSPPSLSAHDSFDSLADTLPPQPANAQESARNNIIRELVETERKYVQDLEIMQKYSNALSQSNLIDQDTIHLLFPNLNKLLNFQRKFLIKFESAAELPWPDQRWGQLFLESEDEFVVYEPYCANYTNATELMLANEESLVPLNHLINVKGELPAFLIKPIQRICKYPLLLDSLIKACSAANYPYFEELKRGSESAKRITDKINEAQRRAENEQTVKSLHQRIDDWKGHHLENFGDLLLDDIFVVTKSDIDREYHVFLFEKIILCCKEAGAQPSNGRKVGKSNSILKKQAVPPPLSLPGGVGQTQRKNTPLLLKGRIFLGNVTQAIPAASRNSTASGIPVHYPLSVWWKGDDDLEFFTLRCRREDQMRQWETQINRLIKETALRRQSERGAVGMSGMSRIATNSTNPAPHSRFTSTSQSHNSYSSPVSMYSNTSTAISGGRSIRSQNPYGMDDRPPYTNGNSSYGLGPHGYPPDTGFEFEPDDEDFEDYPPASNYATSGRGTPLGSRKSNNAMSVHQERDSMVSYDRSRANTDPTEWRNGAPPIPSSSVMSPNGALRPITPRLNSTVSAKSYQSDASFGSTAPLKSATRPPLRSQFSSTRLNSGYEGGEYRNGRAGTPTTLSGTPNGLAAPPMNRSRSASQPSAYIPKSVPPPLPQGQNPSHWSRSNTSMGTNKRGSGSSESTGESSDYSPNSSSPITPFGSSESSLGAVGIRNSRPQGFETAINGHDRTITPPVKVKVHFHEDIFVIQVPRATEYDELVERVGRKIRLCGPRRDDGPLRVKYKDEDGDMVSLGSTEDVQMAFEQWRPGGQVTLFVQ